MEEDRQLVETVPKGGAIPKKKDVTKIVALPPNNDVTFVSASEFPGTQYETGTCENPISLRDTVTEASNTGACLYGPDVDDKAKMLGHLSDTLHEMAASIINLEGGYLKTLHEAIVETEKALRNISCIDSHYVSRVGTLMATWQEVVQAAMSHMENANLTIYLMCREDVWRATKEYVPEVIKACEEHDSTVFKEQKEQKEAIKADDHKDPVVHLLHVTCRAVRAQAERAVDAFLKKIEETLQKHVPVGAEGHLIANSLSTAFQFQMSVWQMIGGECIHSLWAKHSDRCGLAGIIQTIVETFPKNWALMFPPAPMPTTSFSGTFKPASFEDDDDDDSFGTGPGLHRLDSGSPAPSGSGCRGFSRFSHSPTFSSNDEGHGEKDQPGDDSVIDFWEVEILKGIINPGADNQPPTAPKSGNKQGPAQLNGSGSSDSSGEDLDAKGI